MAHQDPLRNFRYRLEINHIEQAGFAKVTVGDLSIGPIEYQEGDEITTVRKLDGLNKYGNITLKWGITASMELADWHQC
ncbi:MAG: phage tail protein [Candidatus Poribacteria bacterium]|nr:phage tail protein [Candidatus Poribacteria bacterium]